MSAYIKTKVVRVILATSISALALISVASMISIFTIRRLTLQHSNNLGVTASGNSQIALKDQVEQQLRSLALDKAALTDEKLAAIQNQTKMAADMATHIYANKTHYRPRIIDYLQPGQAGATALYLITAHDVPLDRIRDEVYLAANVTDILRQITVVDSGINASYIAGESGYFILVDKASSNPSRSDFDARKRNWYIGAKENDAIFWTDIFTDASGRGGSISCAMPFYDFSNGERVLKGVAGSGMALSLNVNQIIDSTRIGETGYAFLLNGKGQVIVTPNNTGLVIAADGSIRGEDYLHSEDPGKQKLARRMLNRENGITEIELDGKTVYVAFYPLSVIDWSLGVVVPVDEIIAPALKLKQDILSLTRNAMTGINRNIIIILIIILAMTAVFFVGAFPVALRLANSLTAPIISLNEGAKIISGGDLNHKLMVKTGDEIETLADSFNAMIDDIQAITAEKQRINSELAIASEIQNDMLPRIFPTFSDHTYFSLFAKMEPAKEVGGDFYDFFYLDSDETKIVFVIADVSGKGVPAALFMVIAKTLIKQQMLHTGDPAAVLKQVNKILCEDNPRSMFATAFIASLDLLTGQMIYANGGHNPPLLSVSGRPYQFMELKKGIPPGMLEMSEYKLCFLQLKPGDALYLYTDGVNEAMDPAGEQFGNKRFLAAANSSRGLPPQEFDAAIRHEVELFANGAEQSDDITTIAIVYKGPET